MEKRLQWIQEKISVWDRVSHWNWSSLVWLAWPASKPKGSPCVSALGFQVHTTTFKMKCLLRASVSGPHDVQWASSQANLLRFLPVILKLRLIMGSMWWRYYYKEEMRSHEARYRIASLFAVKFYKVCVHLCVRTCYMYICIHMICINIYVHAHAYMSEHRITCSDVHLWKSEDFLKCWSLLLLHFIQQRHDPFVVHHCTWTRWSSSIYGFCCLCLLSGTDDRHVLVGLDLWGFEHPWTCATNILPTKATSPGR